MHPLQHGLGCVLNRTFAITALVDISRISGFFSSVASRASVCLSASCL